MLDDLIIQIVGSGKNLAVHFSKHGCAGDRSIHLPLLLVVQHGKVDTLFPIIQEFAERAQAYCNAARILHNRLLLVTRSSVIGTCMQSMTASITGWLSCMLLMQNRRLSLTNVVGNACSNGQMQTTCRKRGRRTLFTSRMADVLKWIARTLAGSTNVRAKNSASTQKKKVKYFSFTSFAIVTGVRYKNIKVFVYFFI